MGASLPKPISCTVLERHGDKHFRVGVAEMNGWRNSMEDAHVVHMADGEGYFGVLDGHGGGECSAWCSQRLQEQLAAHGCPKDDAAAKKLLLDTDHAFLSTGMGSGSTAAMCCVRKPATPGGKYRLHVINAGDSRVLLSRADGTIIDGGGTDQGLTTDHKPDHPVERARIERCGGTVEQAMGGVYRVNGDLAVSRGFGDAEYKKTGGPGPEDRPVTADPEMGHFECAASDFVIIVCDGVSEGNFSNAEVCEHAAKVLKETGGDAAKAAEAVVFRALEAESKDNISCMIVLLGGENRPREFQKEFHPGCLIGADDANFRKAYTAMCARGGVRFAEAVEVRHASLIRKPSAARTATDVAELELIGSPPGAEGSAQREAWFEGWADMVAQRSGSMDDDDDDDDDGGIAVGGRGAPGGPPGSQQEVMRMLMGMMQQQQMQQQQRQQQQVHMQMQRGPGGRAGGGAAGQEEIEVLRQGAANLEGEIASLEDELARKRSGGGR